MAVGKLIVSPQTVRDLPSSGLSDARLFVGCYVQEGDKHRTHSENGPQPFWNTTLTCNVPEGENYLHVELINENPNRGGILATGKAPLKQVFETGRESQYVSLKSTASNESFGELKLNLTFNGTSSTSNVTSSFSEMNLGGGQHVSYSQTTSYSHTSSHHQSESRQSSYSSLGPANPIPENYGAGSPPPFHPPAPLSYPEKGGSMPGTPTAGGLVGADGIVDPQKMTEGEFEEAKARGSLPKWAKYGGGALAGVAALGLAAWGAHEAKEHFDKKEEEEERKKLQEKKHNEEKKPEYHAPPPQQQPYTIYNQQQEYQQKPKYQEHSEKKEHRKKEKKHKKHDSDSSSDSSDSSDDEGKHHKKKDNEWR